MYHFFTNELSLLSYAIVGHVRREEFIYKKTKHKWALNGSDLKYMYRICFLKVWQACLAIRKTQEAANPTGSSLARMRSAALEISNTNYHTDLWQEDDGLVVGWELQQFSHPLSLFTCSLRADTWAKCRTNKQLLTRPGHGPKMRLRP
jgi:hypothetical protein